MNNYPTELVLDLIKKWAEDKRKEGFIPSIELLIEDLENLNKQNGN